jgi:hypothetical protein
LNPPSGSVLLLAERVGFEPTVGKPDTRSPGVPVRPLQHLSAERVANYALMGLRWLKDAFL